MLASLGAVGAGAVVATGAVNGLTSCHGLPLGSAHLLVLTPLQCFLQLRSEVCNLILQLLDGLVSIIND